MIFQVMFKKKNIHFHIILLLSIIIQSENNKFSSISKQVMLSANPCLKSSVFGHFLDVFLFENSR